MTQDECIEEATRRLSNGDGNGALLLAFELIEKFGHPQGARIGAAAATLTGDRELAARLEASFLRCFDQRPQM